MCRWLGLLTLLALVACHREPTAIETPAAVVATSDTLEFGVVSLLESKQRWLELENRTSTILHVTGVDVLDHAAFSVDTSVTEIPAHQSLRLAVDFHPQTRGAQSSTLTVLTDSKATPGLTVTLSGTGLGSGVVLKTPVLDFHAVLTGEQKTLPLILVNEGTVTEQVTIADPSSASIFFTSGRSSATPFSIAPEETLQFPVTFAPFESTTQDVKLRVRLCAECNTTEVSLVAQGVESYFTTNPIDELLFDSNVPSPKQNQRVLPLEMMNAGDAPVTVTAIEVVSGGEWASVDMTGPLTVPPQGQQSVSVTAQIDGLAHEGLLRLTTTDERRPEVLIKLIVPETPVDGCLLVAPGEVDFGTSELSCFSGSRTITLYNVCSWSLTLQKISFTNDDSHFSLVVPPLPLVMTPSRPIKFDVRYSAMEVGTYLAEVQLELNDAAQPFTIGLRGAVKSLPHAVDTFTVPPRPQTDLLFVIDDSPSMAQYQRSLETNLEWLKAYGDGEDIDMNIAVTTMDVSATGERGRFVPLDGSRPKVVTDQMADGDTIFHDNANVGVAGSTTQHGLEAMMLALDPTILAGDNAGFLRPDAFLSVILISASPESSPGVVDDYVSQIQLLKGPGAANMVAVATVSVPTPTDDRFAEVARQTGGISTSIDISDWSHNLAKVSYASSSLKTHFPLDQAPADPASIEVKVNGQVVPATVGSYSNWWYTKSSNSVEFNALSIPPHGSTIEISYDLGCQ